MIIGLTGAKGSGKDTVGAYLVKANGFERKAFVDPLKKSVSALLGLPFAEIERMKNDPTAKIGVVTSLPHGATSPTTVHREITMREFLQLYGTESHRDIFGKDFWVDLTLPVQGYYPGRAIVVTDVRFANEANRIKQLGGCIWAIERDSLDSGDTHVSEIIDFPIDLVVKNNGTIDELFDEVERALMQMNEGIRE